MAAMELFVIKNAKVWNAREATDALKDVYVWGTKVHKIMPAGVVPQSLGGEWAELDAKGKVLLPAGVDLQVHLRVPGQAEKELPLTGLMAALRGGVTAVLTMPNTKPVIDEPKVIELAEAALKDAATQTGVEVFYTVAMTREQQGREAVDASLFKNDRRVLALTDDGRGVARDEVMREVFKQGEASGLPLLQHAEMPGHGGILSPCAVQKNLGIPAYPDSAEIDMVKRDLALLAEFPRARYHVQHVSLMETVDLVKEAQHHGLMATCEVTSHHLLFSRDDIEAGNTSFKMNPPLRSVEDKEALIDALADGRIDFVTTDHAPHQASMKGADFMSSAFGTTGLETSLRALFKLVKMGRLKPERMVEVFSTAPAKWAKIDNKYGYLYEGSDFNAVLFDDQAVETAIELKDLHSLSKNNIFLGTKLPGRVCGVFNHRGFFRFESL